MNDPRNREELLASVLGPGRPELTCEECFEELDRYVEIERTGSDPDAAIPERIAAISSLVAASSCGEERSSGSSGHRSGSSGISRPCHSRRLTLTAASSRANL